MASYGRRRRPLVDISESDDEDVRVLNEMNNTVPSRTQHILLSDDEDDSFTPPTLHPPQQMSGAWQPVVDVLRDKGVKPRTEWLLSCLNQLAASHAGFAQMPADMKAELCFEQFLVADFNVAGAASLPPSMHTLHAIELPGPFVLQVDEIIDISNSSRDRYQDKAPGPGRMLKLSMTDGAQRVFGIEYRPIKAFQVLSPAGFKVSLRNVCIRRGLLILVPEILEVLGGVVDHLEAARLRAVETINKPPRGRRVPRGVREPTLAERATRAAWPDENEQDSMNPLVGSRNSGGISTLGTANSLRVAVQQREQDQFIPQDQVADFTRPSAQVTPGPRSARMETGRSAPQGETAELNTRATSKETFSASVTYQSTSMDVVQDVQQLYPMGQDQNSLSSRQLGRVNNTNQPAQLEDVQDELHHRARQEHGGESSRDPRNVSVMRQSSEVESVQQVREQHQQPCHSERDSESNRQSNKLKQSATHAVEESTPPISSQSPGAPLLSPSFGRLSLRTRRSTPAIIPHCTYLQLSQPSELSTGDEPEVPVEVIESQQRKRGTSAESRAVNDSENFPFTYLLTLEDVRNANMGQDLEVRGRVKESVNFSTRAVMNSNCSFILRMGLLLQSVLLHIRLLKIL